MVDFAQFDLSDASSVMTVMDPTSKMDVALLDDDGNPVTITLASIDSEIYRKAQRDAANARLASGRRERLTVESVENQTLIGMAKCTLDMHGIVYNGAVVKASDKEAVVSLYRRLPWLLAQVDAFMGERLNFMKPSPEG
jgi:hypothetical protein